MLSLPAQAATGWLIHVAVSGPTPTTSATSSNGTTIPSTTWTAPADATNAITIPSYSSGQIQIGCGPGQTASCMATVNLSVKITGTWQGSDPPPPSVDIIESGQATATGTDTHGYGTPVLSANDGLEGSPGNTGIAVTPSAVPPAHLSVQKGGSWSFTRAFSVSAQETVTVPSSAPSYYYYTCQCSAALDGYTLQVHAQPYNMVLSSFTDPSSGKIYPAVDMDNVNGILTFHYSVSSTDGSPSHLTSISAYETLDWSGNSGGSYPPNQYEPPSPPVRSFTNPSQPYAYNNPDRVVMPYVTQGYVIDQFSPPGTGFVTPYPFPSTVWKVTQNYLFDDSQTGEIGTKIPGPDNKSPFTITRTVTPTNLAGTTGTYSVTTRGSTASKPL